MMHPLDKLDSRARTALLVVDVQVGVMAQAWDSARVIRNVCHVVARARAERAPVLWVQHDSDELPHGSDAWALVPALTPAAGELRLEKRFASAFEATPLDEALATLGVRHVVLAGAATNWCIRATAYGALDRGYDLTLVEDAHTTESIDLADGSRIEASGIVAELNVAMTWLRYPDRTNRTAAADEVTFAT